MLRSLPASSSPFAEVLFAGLRFTPMSVKQAVSALALRPAALPFATFVTPNAEHAWLRKSDPVFRAHTDACWISTNDSRVVGRAARLAGLELDFAPGAYVVRALFDEVIKPDTPICILGGAPDLIDRLKARYGLTAVAHHNPPMGFIRKPEAVAETIEFVAANPTAFVFVCMGPPQSELFCQHLMEDGRATGIGLCVGSSLSVLTGDSNPAPDWMERSGLVWLYRLVKEPGRLWRRYLVRGFYALFLACRDILALRLGLARKAGRADTNV
ncbi:WecB/TagA/CpsF family glycosyltransferase [Caulobacter hibisci]|uniref:WecB/TagA/CpsF family glycosyltransferase n=1 Tax=Caulobacter hibisci TaxID=2035993 RepID=A0ABS0STI6_9CAUL|nr:WecB/TagA/CpsF family glycosyltransferase [Caulobacter hibisci]MBI1682824.1 WecB/TagA/CpsF family glycosyltransferase [Caulobacter hibisci]